MAPEAKPHAVVFAFPEIGHVTPLSRLSLQLASMDYVITILSSAPFSHASSFNSRLSSLLPPPSLQSKLGIDVRLVEVPSRTSEHQPLKDLGCDSSLGNILLAIELLQKQQEDVEVLISSLQPPVTCIVSDTFLFWTKDLALRLKIPRALFWTSSATLLVKLARPQGEARLLDEGTSLHFFRHPLISAFTEKQLSNIDDARCMLVNSFEELENIAREEAVLPIPLHAVGPLLPYLGDLQEGFECIRWLDGQPTSSVIYIAFGSVSSFEQIEQLALGLEATKRPFLWTFAEDPDQTRRSRLPQGFAERMKYKGLVVPWTPQLQVLAHPSVGCFLTHCGWNSTMEAIFSGVPMLCCPLAGDQILNKELVVKKWQVGIELERKEDGSIEAKEIQRGITLLMESKEGKQIRKQSEKLKEMAKVAVMAGGSSSNHVAAFLQNMAA